MRARLIRLYLWKTERERRILLQFIRRESLPWDKENEKDTGIYV